MEPIYEQQYTVKCKKCGETHPVEVYREVKFYQCPKVNKVLLMAEEKQGEEDGRRTIAADRGVD